VELRRGVTEPAGPASSADGIARDMATPAAVRGMVAAKVSQMPRPTMESRMLPVVVADLGAFAPFAISEIAAQTLRF
tara:strand:- start:206 stop:436 length:231 start_codon:yes stop_codon:yes gene_type:complete